MRLGQKNHLDNSLWRHVAPLNNDISRVMNPVMAIKRLHGEMKCISSAQTWLQTGADIQMCSLHAVN
jgi:hypothetical protein